MRRLSGALVEALYVPVDKRVVRRLLDLDLAFATTADATTIPITQEELAQLAGTTRPTANRVLRELEDRGIITLARGKLVVEDRSGLAGKAR